jgi:hypothetical protein
MCVIVKAHEGYLIVNRKYKNSNVRIILIVLFLLFTCWFAGCSLKRNTIQPPRPNIYVPLVSVQGTGSDRLGKIQLSNSVGYCEIGGSRVAAAVYKVQNWTEYHLTIVSIVAPTPANLNIMYLYCKGDKIRSVWHEDYSRSLKSEKAMGECRISREWGNTRPELSILETKPSPNQLIHNIEIAGEGIEYKKQAGTIRIADIDQRLYPFEYVDCSDCVRGSLKGWHELHSIIEGPDGDLGFGVLYLYVNKPEQISLHYHIRLAPLKFGLNPSFTGAWNFVGEP